MYSETFDEKVGFESSIFGKRIEKNSKTTICLEKSKVLTRKRLKTLGSCKIYPKIIVLILGWYHSSRTLKPWTKSNEQRREKLEIGSLSLQPSAWPGGEMKFLARRPCAKRLAQGLVSRPINFPNCSTLRWNNPFKFDQGMPSDKKWCLYLGIWKVWKDFGVWKLDFWVGIAKSGFSPFSLFFSQNWVAKLV